MNNPVIVDLFKSITTEVSAALGYTVHFHHGHMLEIVNNVKALSADPDTDKRYPLIAFRHDIKQGRNENGLGFEVTLFIITLSDTSYSADQREELTFKAWLTPIYDELINQIARSGYFMEQSRREVELNHKFIEHYFWGNAGVMGNDANIFGDAVDCIEIENLKLTAIKGCVSEILSNTVTISLTGGDSEYFDVTVASIEYSQSGQVSVDEPLPFELLPGLYTVTVVAPTGYTVNSVYPSVINIPTTTTTISITASEDVPA